MRFSNFLVRKTGISFWTTVIVVAAWPTFGQQVPGDSSAVPGAVAVFVSDSPMIDGQVAGDPAWNNIDPVTGFRQTTPDEGALASERTEVRIAYSDDTLFFGVILYDRDPSTIVVSDSRRDSPLSETDSFQIILDTYLDQQNGFVFGTNPSGLEYDGQVTNEGEGSGRFGVVGGGKTGSGVSSCIFCNTYAFTCCAVCVLMSFVNLLTAKIILVP